MSHRLYHTEGFVLDSTPMGESHTLLLLLTDRLGVVRAFVRSSREERSKLRYHTQRYTFAFFNLVRGREMWRITGASSCSLLLLSSSMTRESGVVVARVAHLLKRLLQGEERDEQLFVIVRSFIQFLSMAPRDRAQLHNAECVTVLRILHVLGYVGDAKELRPLLAEATLTDESLAHAHLLRRHAIAAINRSLAVSHL